MFLPSWYVHHAHSMYTYSLETELTKIENDKNIAARWQPSSNEFVEVLDLINTGKRQVIKGKLLGVVKERVFYVNTLRHHAGRVSE